MKDLIVRVLAENGTECGDEQAGKLSLYLDLLLEENRKTNLTAITDKERAVVLHAADSILASRFIPRGKLLDIGSGAGLPAVPLAVMREDVAVTALDATEKKTAFIARAARELGLGNLTVMTGRAEELGRGPRFREKFDAVTARAVARLDVLCELAGALQQHLR
ncbi:MAG: 16S rRNA (guanine(527)-N(7))-methyltransferase RsmG, partial [Clostridia bacterium]|nr:16S rRNA (guanine(527)-N(7))-methyltransferase RsmG [Clostridia bacterium]